MTLQAKKIFLDPVHFVTAIFIIYCRFPGMQTLPSNALISSLDPASVSSEELLHQLAAQQKSSKKWLLIQPMSAMLHPDFSYALSSKNSKKYSSRIPLPATKGCPAGCNFCTTPTVYGKHYRYRELDLVLDEISLPSTGCQPLL